MPSANATALQSLRLAVVARRSVVATIWMFGIGADDLVDHHLEVRRVEFGEVVVDTVTAESEGGGEVLLVAEHHVDERGDGAVDLDGAIPAALVCSCSPRCSGIVAIGQTLVMLIGGIDLSVSAVITFVNLVVAATVAGNDGRIWLAVVLAAADRARSSASSTACSSTCSGFPTSS